MIAYVQNLASLIQLLFQRLSLLIWKKEKKKEKENLLCLYKK